MLRLQLIATFSGGELHLLASLDRLDAALRRYGWRRTTAWITHPDSRHGDRHGGLRPTR